MNGTIRKCLSFVLLLLSIVILSACSNSTTATESAITTTIGNTTTILPTTTTEEITTLLTTERCKTDYTFTYFQNEVVQEVSQVADGVTLVKNTLHKTDGKLVVIYALEVDLNTATIVAGTYNNQTFGYQYTRATPYAQATAFENATGRAVYASINADFFGSTCVNAFVKDGYIIKNAHNSNGSFDYTDSSADVPASAPMLFGVSGDVAQVKPIRSYTGDITGTTAKQRVVTSQLSYKIVSGLRSINCSASINFSKSSVVLTNGGSYAIVDISNGVTDMSVKSIETVETTTTLPTPGENEAYLYALSINEKDQTFITDFAVGDKVELQVKSATNTWNGYTTILGCRQSLVQDGEIASTVTLENSNGAQSKDVPRSAVGVKDESTVVVFAVESMYYGSIASSSDSHGVSLPELAEFMYYYNIVDGANFDGGGSTQLTVRNDNTLSKVVVRSSDTGSYDPSSSRKVMNTLLVVEKEK